VAQNLPSEKLEMVDGFRDFGVGLAPRLADFQNFPRNGLESPFPQYFSGPQKQRGSFHRRHVLPRRERTRGGVYGPVYLLGTGHVAYPDDLFPVGRVDRLVRLTRADALAADDERVFAAEPGLCGLDGLPHATTVF